MAKLPNISAKLGGRRDSPVGPAAEKSRDFKGTLARLVRFMRPFYGGLAVALLFTVLSAGFEIFAPKILGNAIDVLFEGVTDRAAGIDFKQLFSILLLLLGIYLLSALFSWLQEYVMAGISGKIVSRMREDAGNKLHRLPLKFFDSNSHGDILSRFTNDIDTVGGTLQQSIVQIITAAATMLGIITMMLVINPLLSLVTFVALPLSFLLTGMIASRSQRFFVGQAQGLGRLNGHIEEMLGAHAVVKAFNYEHKSINTFQQYNNTLYACGWKAQFASSVIHPVMNFTGNLMYVIICVLGCYMVVAGRITLGSVQAFITYSRRFNQPVMQLSQLVNVLQSTVAAAERYFEIMDEPEESHPADNPHLPATPRGSVDFAHVSFRYMPDRPLLEDVDIRVEPGQLVAIVGPTGAGKTTLVNLLMRFYLPDSGRIAIDGIDINDMGRKQLHSLTGMVLQDTWLFKGTIRENIAFGRRGATDDEVIHAAKLACADGFIRALPDGYDTLINEEAANISQGQKQLLTIARALIVQPSIIILDEATSSVDTRTEILIQRAMKQIMYAHTSFVIAHRLSTIREADNILVMKDGNIIEQGTHNELLARKGFYYELYNSQRDR
ncbi:MAG: ABC transporter ATP-binding protein/permease [Bacteroidales bacterium]|jgi:ATP-binding cassette subfamily B protein|nr:ABC transporter ATP-binding protein/permease [Bacteroidales bacterium]